MNQNAHPARLSIIGAGAFGQFMVPHLAPHYEILLADPRPDLDAVAARLNVAAVSMADAARAPVIILAVPVQAMGAVATALAPHVPEGALILDVGSVKVKPARLLSEIFPDPVDIVCTHPLFGPQSAHDGIRGLKITVCPVRGSRGACVTGFCRDTLGLRVMETTPERHDRELAYVQGITHLIGKTLLTMDLEAFDQTTVSYDLLRQAVGYIADDSAELFRAIELENPFAPEARTAFFDAVRRVEADLKAHDLHPEDTASPARSTLS